MKIFVHQCTKYAILYVSQESFSCLGFAETRPDHEFLVFYFSFITIEHFAFIYHRSPRCRQPSTIATPRCHSQSTPALAFTIGRCAFIHHRPQRFHLVLICSVSGYVKFLSKGKHIKSWYICGHVWILAKGQTRFVLIYTAGTVQK